MKTINTISKVFDGSQSNRHVVLNGASPLMPICVSVSLCPPIFNLNHVDVNAVRSKRFIVSDVVSIVQAAFNYKKRRLRHVDGNK